MPAQPGRVPRLIKHVDVRSLKLDATDGFLMTRIDGKLGPKELSADTGLPDFSVMRALEKLEKLGVVEWIDPKAPPPEAAPPPPARDRTKLPEFASLGDDPKYDLTELDEEIDLSRDQRKRILDLFYRLDDLDHYTLLGLGKEADKKTVKRAYFELAAMMHPDRYFKKNLGSFKPKMEALFGRITEAHDTLVDVGRRLDYDSYLDEVATTKGMEAMFERALEESRRTAASAPPEAATSAPPPTNGASASIPPASKPSGPSAADLQARREALARRLLGGGGGPRPAAAPAPSIPPAPSNPLRYASAGDAMDALKRRYEERIDNATAAQARRYVQAAEDALSKNDVVSAAASFNIACKFAPEDATLAARYHEVKLQADDLLCESYVKQAQYEERSAHWTEAARSWQKVAKIKVSDPKAHERSAFCLLHSPDADLHEAAEHAKQAVGLEPGEITHHVTLAEIYLKADKGASARRAAETGLQLDPKNAALAAVIKKATKN